MYSVSRLFVLASAAAGLAVAVHPAGSEPSVSGFLSAVYGSYQKPPSGTNPLDTVATIERFFSPRLAALLVKNRKLEERGQEIVCLDADPLIDAQDYELSDFHMTGQVVGPKHAIGTASFLNLNHKVIVRFDLVLSGGAWKIDDIRSNVRNSSFRLDIETCLKRLR